MMSPHMRQSDAFLCVQHSCVFSSYVFLLYRANASHSKGSHHTQQHTMSPHMHRCVTIMSVQHLWVSSSHMCLLHRANASHSKGSYHTQQHTTSPHASMCRNYVCPAFLCVWKSCVSMTPSKCVTLKRVIPHRTMHHVTIYASV